LKKRATLEGKKKGGSVLTARKGRKDGIAELGEKKSLCEKEEKRGGTPRVGKAHRLWRVRINDEIQGEGRLALWIRGKQPLAVLANKGGGRRKAPWYCQRDGDQKGVRIKKGRSKTFTPKTGEKGRVPSFVPLGGKKGGKHRTNPDAPPGGKRVQTEKLC